MLLVVGGGGVAYCLWLELLVLEEEEDATKYAERSRGQWKIILIGVKCLQRSVLISHVTIIIDGAALSGVCFLSRGRVRAVSEDELCLLLYELVALEKTIAAVVSLLMFLSSF